MEDVTMGTIGRRTIPVRRQDTEKGTTRRSAIATECCDRMIPCRRAMDMEAAHDRIIVAMRERSKGAQPSDHTSRMGETTRVLRYNAPREEPHPLRQQMNLDHSVGAMLRSPDFRCFESPELILDAPKLVDNFYYNVLDWRDPEGIAIALGKAVYIYNVRRKGITLKRRRGSDLCGLAFVPHHSSVMASCVDGSVALVDTGTNAVSVRERKRTIGWPQDHRGAILSLEASEGRPAILAGRWCGCIEAHDLRCRDPVLRIEDYQKGALCGLSFQCRPGSQLFASGANDNTLCVWDIRNTGAPVWTGHHRASVKAIAWSPCDSSYIASGGGADDQELALWDVTGGKRVRTVRAQSQICSLVWSSDRDEIASAHGYHDPVVRVWTRPTGKIRCRAELKGSNGRLLHMKPGPDGIAVAFAGSEERLRVWNAFPPSRRSEELRNDRPYYPHDIIR